MPLSPLFGHTTLRARCESALARQALPGSLLLHGPRGIGKQRFALWLGQRLLCNAEGTRPCGTCQHCRYALKLTHPDLHWFFPRPRLKDSDPSPEDIAADYGEAIAERVAAHGLYPPPGGDQGIYIATVRALVRSASLTPALAAHKVFVIGDAERMVPQIGAEYAANAFLKLLEEPPPNTTIVLTSSEPGALLPTIRSRVAAVRVAPLNDTDVRAFLGDEQVRAHLATLSVPAKEADRVTLAHGAPGVLFAQSAWDEALERARRLLDAAVRGDRADRMREAFIQGSAKSRGGYSDALDALTSLLRDRAREAVGRADERAAVGAARAVAFVEEAKERAAGNANPQLVTATLLHALEGALQ